MTSYKVSYQWMPIVDQYRYRPLPVSVDFLQNVFDLVFLLIFIWYWNWGPVMVVLYYLVETCVMYFFTSIKWWKSKLVVSDDFRLTNPLLKVITILIGCLIIGVFSYGQLSVIHEVLNMKIAMPSIAVIMSDDKQFLLGVLAILLQQSAEYYKYNLLSKTRPIEMDAAVLTPILRLCVQQLSVMLGIIAVAIMAFVDWKLASMLIALILGLMKIVFGQLQLEIKK